MLIGKDVDILREVLRQLNCALVLVFCILRWRWRAGIFRRQFIDLNLEEIYDRTPNLLWIGKSRLAFKGPYPAILMYLVNVPCYVIHRGFDLLINDLLWLCLERIRVPRLDDVKSCISKAVRTSGDGCKTSLDRYGVTPCSLSDSLGGVVRTRKVGVLGKGRMYRVKWGGDKGDRGNTAKRSVRWWRSGLSFCCHWESGRKMIRNWVEEVEALINGGTFMWNYGLGDLSLNLGDNY